MSRKVLLVDDDADVRAALCATLADCFELSEAASGEEAMATIASDRPAVVLLDLTMPEMDGLAVLRALKDLDPSLPILVLTGHRDLERAREALDHGARAYMTKPFDPAYLRAELLRLLSPPPAGEPGGRPWRTAYK